MNIFLKERMPQNMARLIPIIDITAVTILGVLDKTGVYNTTKKLAIIALKTIQPIIRDMKNIATFFIYH